MSKKLRVLLIGLCVIGIGTATTAAVATLQQFQSDGSGGAVSPPSPMKQATARISENRQAVIEELVNRPFLPTQGPLSDRGELRQALARLSGDQLAEAYLADDFAQFSTATLDRSFSSTTVQPSGAPLPASLDTRQLGDPITDLVFYRVEPCRFFDTRTDSRGLMTANETRNFAVQGSLISDQGGNASDCPDVPFDPPVVVFTLTAANPQGNGNVRAWAFGDPQPGVSNLNFTLATNIANTTFASVCQGCGTQSDINVRVSLNQAQVLGDIIGYFDHPEGCSSGLFRVGDKCMTALRPTTSSVFAARNDCTDEGARLPTPSEVWLALETLTGASSPGEYTDSLYHEGNFEVMRILSGGGLSEGSTLVDAQYRCVFDLFGPF